jgi:DNA primase
LNFYGCVTFPLYDANGDPSGIYGRRIDPALPKGYAGTSEAAKPGSDRHLYLSGQRLCLFNRQAARSHKEIILAESVIDSLTLIDARIAGTIPAYGINGVTGDHLQ